MKAMSGLPADFLRAESALELHCAGHYLRGHGSYVRAVHPLGNATPLR